MARLELTHDPAARRLRLQLERSGRITAADVAFEFTIGRDELEALRWAIEDHGEDEWRGSHGDDYARHARGIAADVGSRLFEATFGDESAATIREAVLEDLSGTDIEIRNAGAETSSALPWELMTEPVRSLPVALHARSFSRAVATDFEPYSDPVTCRVLIVISRPDLTADVPMTSVASQIVAAAIAAGLPLSVEVARPPTFESVEGMLCQAAAIGLPYSAVHFDGHGVFRTEQELVQSGLSVRPEPEDRSATVRRGFLIFERPGRPPEAVSGSVLARACHANGVRCVVLNACQSAMELPEGSLAVEPHADGVSADPLAYGSLADELLRHGMAGVVAMRYAVRVEAAATIMRALYDMLFAGTGLGPACTAARRAVSSASEPVKELDWLVPAVYQLPEVEVIINPGQHEPGGLVSPALENLPAADTILLQLDRAFDRSQVAFLTGWPGTGKSMSASAFAYWYAVTGGCHRGVANLRITADVRADDVVRLLAAVRDEGGGTFEASYGTDADAQAALLRFGQQLVDLPALVILDQFEQSSFMPTAQRAAILDLLREHDDPALKILVVSCRDDGGYLEDALPQIRVGTLSEAGAMRLARETAADAGSRLSDRQVRFLVSAAGGIPALVTCWSRISPPPAAEDWWRVPATAYPPDAEARTADYFTRALRECLTAEDRLVLSALSFFHGRVSSDALTATLFGERFAAGTEIQGRVSITVDDTLGKAAQLGLLIQEDRITFRIHPCLPGMLSDARSQLLREASTEDSPLTEADFADQWLRVTARLANETRDIVEEGYHHALFRLSLQADNIMAALGEAKRRSDWALIIQLLQGLRTLHLSESRLGPWSELLAGLEDSYRAARDQPRWRQEVVVYLSYKAELSMIRNDERRALATYAEILAQVTGEAQALLELADLTDHQAATLRAYGVVEEKTGQILSRLRDATCFAHFDAALRAYTHLDDGQAEAVLSLLRAEAHRAFDDPDQALRWVDRAFSRLNPYDLSRRAAAWLIRGMALGAQIRALPPDAAQDETMADRLLDEAFAALANSALEAPTEQGTAEAERHLAGLLNEFDGSPEDAAAAALRSLGYYARAEPGSDAHLDCLLQAGMALQRARRADQAAIHLRALMDMASPAGESAHLRRIAERLLGEIDRAGTATPTDSADMLPASRLVDRVRRRLDAMDDDPQSILDPQAKEEADELLERLAPPISSPVFTDALQAVAFLFQVRSQTRPELAGEQPVALALFAILNTIAPHKVPEQVRHYLDSTSFDTHPAVLAAALATDMVDDPGHAEDLGWLNTALGLLHTATTAFPAGEPSLGMYLFNLGNTWRTRYTRRNAPTDLDHAIDVGRQAIALTPQDHPNLAGRLNNLAVALLMRFDLTGESADLAEATEVRQRIAGQAATPPPRPYGVEGASFHSRTNGDQEDPAGEAAQRLQGEAGEADGGSPNEDADMLRVDQLIAQGEHEAAADVLVKAAQAGNGAAQHRVGQQLEQAGRAEAAIPWYQRAAGRGLAGAMTRLGVIHYRSGDRAAAQPWLEQAAARSDAYAMYILGGLAEDRGDRAAAEHWWRRAAELDDANAMAVLGPVLTGRGDVAEAERLLRRGAELGHPLCMKQLAQLLRARGDKREARLWKARAKEALRRLGPPPGVR